MSDVLTKKNKAILLGNEAIVRGALESGVQFVSTYPGTPASEIGNVFYKIAKDSGVYFEFSVNEKVALEAGIGASFSGLKSLVAMKNFGLNVCSDALLPFVYTGVKGPTVIIVADDPSCHSSAQSEENSRAFAYLSHIPMLEPSDPQECKDFTKLAFEISEKFKIPVLLRTTTRVAHQKTPVKLSGLKTPRNVLGGKFVKDKKRFVTMPPRVLEMKKELLEKIEKIREFAEKSPLNQISRDRVSTRFGIITSGVSYLYVMEALKELKVKLPVLKLGFFYPLPEKKIKNFIKNLEKVLVVEELEPWLEKEIKILAKEINPGLKIIGKELLPEVGELKPEDVIRGIIWTGAVKITRSHNFYRNLNLKKLPVFPKRLPQLCPGCPYWFVFSAIKKAVDPKQAPNQNPEGEQVPYGAGKFGTGQVIFGGDIGCYMLAGLPPHNLQDYLSCMGSSIGIAHGIKKATNPVRKNFSNGAGQKLITLIGDSTFFHAGIPALINTVFNKSNPLIIIMNNLTTAMTGHQPYPGTTIKIENIVKACGVKHWKMIDPKNQKEMIETIKEFLNKKEVSVIIARHPCIFVKK